MRGRTQKVLPLRSLLKRLERLEWFERFEPMIERSFNCRYHANAGNVLKVAIESGNDAGVLSACQGDNGGVCNAQPCVALAPKGFIGVKEKVRAGDEVDFMRLQQDGSNAGCNRQPPAGE